MDANTASALAEWSSINIELKVLKEKEMLLRKQIVDSCFPKPKEGSNTLDLANDWKLKCNYKLSRKVDKAAIKSVLAEMPEGSEEKLINYKPELKLTAYKNLPKEECKVFDQLLTIKPGTPSLELVAPKEKKES